MRERGAGATVERLTVIGKVGGERGGTPFAAGPGRGDGGCHPGRLRSAGAASAGRAPDSTAAPALARGER